MGSTSEVSKQSNHGIGVNLIMHRTVPDNEPRMEGMILFLLFSDWKAYWKRLLSPQMKCSMGDRTSECLMTLHEERRGVRMYLDSGAIAIAL